MKKILRFFENLIKSQILYRVKNKPSHLCDGQSFALFFHSVSPKPLQTHTFRCGYKTEGFGDVNV